MMMVIARVLSKKILGINTFFRLDKQYPFLIIQDFMEYIHMKFGKSFKEQEINISSVELL